MIFAHQAKTGGSSLVRCLEIALGRECVYDDNVAGQRRKRFPLLKFVFALLDRRKISSCRLIHGHFSPEKYRNSFPNAIYLTFYRHPVQQLVSLYYFWKRVVPTKDKNPLRMRLLKEDLSMRAFSEMVCCPENIERFLYFYRLENFDFVGISEAHGASLELFSLQYLPGVRLEAESANVNPDKPIGEGYDLDLETLESLGRLLAPMVELYSEALARFRHECSQHSIEVDLS